MKRLSEEGFGGRTPVPRARRKISKGLLKKALKKKKKKHKPEKGLHGSLCVYAC